MGANRKFFTLVEMVVVVAIIAVSTSLAVATFRGGSSTQLLSRAGWQFEEFCARVRFQAMETGRDRLVVYEPDKRCFRGKYADETEPGGDADEKTLQRWALPEEFTFNAEQVAVEPAPEAEIPLFRFFADGSASGKRRLVFKYRERARYFIISPLTGRLRQSEEAPEEMP